MSSEPCEILDTGWAVLDSSVEGAASRRLWVAAAPLLVRLMRQPPQRALGHAVVA